CVLNPLKVVLTDLAEDHLEAISAPGHPNRDDLGERELPFTRELYIDADDFREEANKKYKRLVLGKRVRLRNAYVIEADEVIKDDAGNIVEVCAHVVPNTLGENPEDGVKPKGVIQWVSASHGRTAQVRLYDRLFNHEAPDRGDNDYLDYLNPDSLVVVENAWVEPALAAATAEESFQFEREGYFVADRFEHSAERPVFNKTIGLRDSWNEGAS
ncbi:MAG: glutamine--tRNA ligase, partial [Halioglobus sp.]|nr:glutamine--tRNA ligase [Halioglobus sp.]